MAMERNDEEQVDFSIDVMHRADRRDHDARRIPLHRLQHRQPEVEVLVVATRDNFIVSDKENRPGPYLFATQYSRLTVGFMISPTVGASRPKTFAAALRTISRTFIQSGVYPNSAKKMSTDAELRAR